MKRVYSDILKAIGNTPIVKLNKVAPGSIHNFYAKLEFMNPGGSVKDRIAMAIIEEAERDGRLKPGGTVVEGTSGNTGLGIGMVAAVRGYRTIFVMPEKISEEKRAILRAFGAEVVITPTSIDPEDPNSYVNTAKRMAKEIPGAILANQFNNPANPMAHYHSTGPEIWEQIGDQLDFFCAGAGTGGSISGIGKYLKEKNKNIKILLADPIGSILYDLVYHREVLTPPASYKVEGVGEDMLPDNVHLDVIDESVRVDDKSSFLMTRKLTREEGICVGPSAAMALCGAISFSKNLDTPKNFLVLFPDSGKAYLSKAFNDQWMKEAGFL
jgi:cystathionine beta-synthase